MRYLVRYSCRVTVSMRGATTYVIRIACHLRSCVLSGKLRATRARASLPFVNNGVSRNNVRLVCSRLWVVRIMLGISYTALRSLTPFPPRGFRMAGP